MDDFCQYNLFRSPRPSLFVPPPYVRASEKHVHGEQKQIPILHLRATDPSRILLLCESLKDQCTIDLEMKINAYLMSEADCDCALLCSFRVLPRTAVVKAIATHALHRHIHIPASDHLLVNITQNKMGVECGMAQLPPAVVDEMHALQPDLDGAVNAFPIYEQKHRNGIAEETNVLSHIVFIVNTTNQKGYLCHLVQECFRFVLPVLTNTTAYERQTQVKNRMQELVETAELLFANVNDKNTLMQCVQEKGKGLFESERCDVYLPDKAKRNLRASIHCNGASVEDIVPKGSGVVGYVYTQNRLLNIKDAHRNALFLKSDDDKCSYRTRNILCFPLTLIHEEVVGCVQMRNKIFGEYNVHDENAAAHFGRLVALAARQANEIEETRGDVYRQQVANKLLAFNLELRPSDVEHLLYAVRHGVDGFELPTFNARLVPPHRISVMLMKMFDELGFVDQFGIERRRLAKFLALIERGHFNHAYHNWTHAFVATHFVYACIRFLHLLERKVLTGLEAMALIIAAISHNVDHKGVSNSFRSMEESTLASLYTSDRSIMETHHFAQTMLVLNSDECNFLANLPLDDYAQCLELIKHNIMATDYAEHLKHLKRQETHLTRGFRPRILEHKLLFCALLMTCSDLCDQLRDWRTVRNVASQMYEEYFQQGELEQAMGKQPAAAEEQIEHVKTRIPQLFVAFLNEVCLPPFQLLVRVYSDMQFCVDAIYDNITNWELAKQQFANRDVVAVTSLDLLAGQRLSFSNFAPVEEAEEEENNPTYTMMADF